MSQQTIDPISESDGDVKLSELARIALAYEDRATGRMALKMCAIRKEDVDKVLKLMSDLRVL